MLKDSLADYPDEIQKKYKFFGELFQAVKKKAEGKDVFSNDPNFVRDVYM